VPPRPKPGRKPATDTPPTKRKAQNRAAQRAFRERRAARVGELEEQLDEQKEEHERVVQEMQAHITHLEVETQTLQSRCQWLESVLEKERSERNDMSRSGSLIQSQLFPQPRPSQAVTRSSQLVPIAPRTTVTATADFSLTGPAQDMTQSFSISHIISPPESAETQLDLACASCHSAGPCSCADDVLQAADIPIGCGGCTIDSRCACLEETFKASLAADLKRPRSPGSSAAVAPGDKRQRSDTAINLETDFTALFSLPSTKQTAAPTLPPLSQPLASIEPKDACGFCEEGTYCVCAESMATAAMLPPSQTLAQQTHTPPPSENDVVPIPMEVTATGAIKLPGLSFQRPRAERPRQPPPPKSTSGCGSTGPGTCAQCLSDPKSGLFCRSLAANFERNNRQLRQQQQEEAGCCGNGGPNGCCKAGNPSAGATTTVGGSSSTDASGSADSGSGPPGPITIPSIGLSLSCADAYKTLASHQHFDEAADDIGSWLPRLRAVPVPPENMQPGLFHGHGHVSAGRAPIEVEAASIMSVLKGFDVRFGRGE